jgi:hypothetical protein
MNSPGGVLPPRVGARRPGRPDEVRYRAHVQAVVDVLVYALAYLCTVEEYDIASAIGALTSLDELVAAQLAWWVTGQLLRRLPDS